MDEDLRVGAKAWFHPKKGSPRPCVIEGLSPFSNTVIVTLEDDPFPIEVKARKVSTLQNTPKKVSSNQKVSRETSTTRKKEIMTPTTKPTGKELRKQAQALGIEGWEDMTRKEMATAIKRAERAESETPKATKPKAVKKTAPKSKPASKPTPAKKAAKAPAKKVVAKKKVAKSVPAEGSDAALGLTFAKGKTAKPLPGEGENPFRKSSNLHIVATLLLKGGTRRALATKLSEKVDLHPYLKDSGDIDLLDYDKRIILAAGTMRDRFGYGMQRLGRGLDGKILVFIPGSDKDPRGKKTPKKAAAKRK